MAKQMRQGDRQVVRSALESETARFRHTIDPNTVARKMQRVLRAKHGFPSDLHVGVRVGGADYFATVDFPSGEFHSFTVSSPKPGIMPGSDRCGC